MPSYDYDYYPLPNGLKPTNTKISRIWRHCFLALLTINVALSIYIVVPRRSEFAPLDHYQHLSNVSVVDWMALPSTYSTTINPDEHAVVSSLYSDSYTMAITTLGHSLKAANVTVRKILIYIPGRLSSRTLCLATAAGWTLHPVSFVPPPHNAKGISLQFMDQYTKLRIWTLDSIGIKSLVYIDADTLVRKNFDELFSLPFNIAAVPDIFLDRGFSMLFNAGVLFLRPNTAVFEDMLEKMQTAVYPPAMAEQAFLNVYFGPQVARLPYAYNANLAIKSRNVMLWEKMQDDMRIVHYTLHKPFPRHGLGPRETLKRFFEGRMTVENGFWADEMLWWQEAWREMSIEIQSHSQC